MTIKTVRVLNLQLSHRLKNIQQHLKIIFTGPKHSLNFEKLHLKSANSVFIFKPYFASLLSRDKIYLATAVNQLFELT